MAKDRNYDFTTKIDEIVVNTQARLLAVVRTAISNVVDDAQTPVAKGGKMRVDTGFLRSTGLADVGKVPIGPSVSPDHATTQYPRRGKAQSYTYDGQFLNIALSKMKIGDTFYFGWTANYAKYREAYDGFLESALQKWQTHVDNAITRLRDRDKK